MNRKPMMMITTLILITTTSCTFLKISLTEEMQPLTEHRLSGEGRDKVLLIDLSGFISSSRDSSSLGGGKRPGMLVRFREELDKARADGAVKAVVLRINSPGGGVTASDELYHELRKFKSETGTAIVAHLMDTGTSGAYYAALAADRITAQPTSVTGSIGVIMYRLDATGLMQKIGLQAIEISSGDRKGMASPFRAITPEEQVLFKDLINSMQDRFVTMIVESRKMPIETVRRLADGRIYTSQQALSAGLIDGIGYLEDAVVQAKKLANLGQASLVTYARPGEYRPNIYSVNLINIDMNAYLEPGAHFMYVWWP